jgi:hypothetical protein
MYKGLTHRNGYQKPSKTAWQILLKKLAKYPKEVSTNIFSSKTKNVRLFRMK